MKKTMMVVAMLACTVAPAFGQDGRVELGAFGRYTWFTRDRVIPNAAGIGAAASIYILDRLRVSGDLSYTKTDSTRFRPIHARLVYEQPVSEAVRLMIGSGIVWNSYTYSRPNDKGFADMAGIKLRLSPPLSIYAQFTHDWMAAALNSPVAMYTTTPTGTLITFNTYNDVNLGAEAGLAFRFGAKAEAAPVAVAPPPAPQPQQPAQQQQPPPPPPPQPAQEQPVAPRYATLVPLYFDVNSSEIRADQLPAADAMVGLLKGNTDAQITITGYADERGSEATNRKLGMRRAQSVKAYLVNNGVTAARLTVASKGENDPVDPGHDESAWAKNRRVEFKVKGDLPLKLVTER